MGAVSNKRAQVAHVSALDYNRVIPDSCPMRLLPLAAAVLLFAAAISLARAVVTREGVGTFEYVVSVVLLFVLLGAALDAGRRAWRTLHV